MRMLAVLLMFALPAAAFAEEPLAKSPEVTAIERGLGFLVKDSLAWKAEYKCHSCHHAAMVVWALRDAKTHGHAVDEAFLAETTKWIAESGDGKTGVPRPEGIPKALNTKAVWYALALGADPQPDETARAGLAKMLKTVQEDQVESGSWLSWPETRPPVFGHSDDYVTALAALALFSSASGGDAESKAALDRGVKWLVETKSDDDPQSIAMRLLLWKKLGRPAEECDALVTRIKERQNADGGWSQAPDMASDAWATGQALYALGHAGLTTGDPAIAKGKTFLTGSQREDGSWLMTSRPLKPGGAGSTSLMPITGAGSAWGVLGLVQTTDKALPKQVDLRTQLERWNLAPRRQGRRNTCSVFVTAGAFEFALSKHHDRGVPLSVEYLNWACNQVIGNATADRGQFFHDLLKGYEQHGLCREELMPYERRFRNSSPTVDAIADATDARKLDFKIHWIRQWSKDSGLTNEQFDETRKTLARGWPVCAGSNHSRLFVGYVDDENEPGGGKFITRDSGIGRYGEVTYEWARQNVYDLFWVELPDKK
jgi:hypothetical protein